MPTAYPGFSQLFCEEDAMRRPPNLTRAFGVCLVLIAFAALASQSVDGLSGTASAADVANLQDQLESGLLAGRPVELVFISRVVTLVEQDALPLPLVLSTYQWARPKKPRPFPYFERGLRIRAARIGIQL
jgi:hypothetical protein